MLTKNKVCVTILGHWDLNWGSWEDFCVGSYTIVARLASWS